MYPWGDPGGPREVLGRSRGVLGGSLGDFVEDLGPHMLCAQVFQCFTSFSACVLGGFFLERTWGAQARKSSILFVLAHLGASSRGAMLVRSQGLPGRSEGRPWGCLEILGDTMAVVGCSWGFHWRLLGGSWRVLGKCSPGPSAHMIRKPMFQRVLFAVALA